MSESLTRQWKVTKQAVRGKGVVVAQNSRAAEVGAEILRKGGNAIDAAVATGMAIGALEPWMSGIGGVGFMTIWSAKEQRAWTIDYGPISARKLDPVELQDRRPRPRQSLRLARHPRAEQRGRLPLDRRARHGRRPGQGARALRHAEMAGRDGAWHRARRARHGARLVHAGDDRQRRAAPRRSSRHRKANYLCDDGRVPTHRLAGQRALPQARQSRRDLSRLADGGPREYYEGSLARDIAADLQAGGSAISYDDLASYEARIVEPLSFEHDGVTINVAGGLTAGPTLAPHARAGGRPHQGQGRARRRLLRRHRRRHAPGLRGAAQDHGRQAHQHLHHAFLRRRLRRQHGGADPDADVAVRLLRDAAQDRHHHEQRHAVVRSRAQPAELDRAGQAAACATSAPWS